MIFDGIDLSSPQAFKIATDLIASMGGPSIKVANIQAFSAQGVWNLPRSTSQINAYYFLDPQNPGVLMDITAFVNSQPKRSVYVGRLRHNHLITSVGAPNPADTIDYQYGITKSYAPSAGPSLFAFKRSQMAPPALPSPVLTPQLEYDAAFTHLTQYIWNQSNTAGLSVTYTYYWDFDGVKIN